MMHAVGFWHEHSREDRDEVVTINYERVASGRDHNFAKKNHLVANLIGKYDICSILHYRLRALQKESIKVSIVKNIGYPKTTKLVEDKKTNLWLWSLIICVKNNSQYIKQSSIFHIQSLIIKFPFCRKVVKRKEKEVAEQYHQKMRKMLKNARVRWASSSTFPSEMLRK